MGVSPAYGRPWRIAWIDADEAAVELVLLASLDPKCYLDATPLNLVRASGPR